MYHRGVAIGCKRSECYFQNVITWYQSILHSSEDLFRIAHRDRVNQ